jgi:hypothetical protein
VPCRSTAALIIAGVLVSAANGSSAGGLRPGDAVGSMRLARGTAATALKLFDICNPIPTSPQATQCGRVPRVKRLFIGYGSFDLPRKIDALWRKTKWNAWIDGRPIDLAAFGSSDRTLFAFVHAGGKNVTLREWRVVLVGATPGRHTLRYGSVGPDGKGDTTWTFTVASKR